MVDNSIPNLTLKSYFVHLMSMHIPHNSHTSLQTLSSIHPLCSEKHKSHTRTQSGQHDQQRFSNGAREHFARKGQQIPHRPGGD